MNTKVKVSVFIVMLGFILALFVSCSTKSDIVPLKLIDITNASNLFIANSNDFKTFTSDSRSSDSDRLFKITIDGDIVEARCYDDEGNDISAQCPPLVLLDINDQYLYVWLDYYGPLLVRKTDGAVFKLGNVYMFESNPWSLRPSPFGNTKYILTDSFDNIYLKGHLEDGSGRYVYKLNVQNPEAITREIYSPESDYVNYFQIDSNDNMIYTGSGMDVCRIKKTNGGLYNLPQTQYFWIGIDGSIYYSYSNDIYKVTIDEFYNVVETNYIEGQGISNANYKIDFSDRTKFIGTSYVDEIYYPSSTFRRLSLVTDFNIKTVTQVSSSDNYYYIAGNNSSLQPVLIKVDPTTDSYTNLLTPGDFDVYMMTVSNTDEIIFNALRMFDGAIVIGKIDASGTLEILDESLNNELTVLERIR